MKAIPSKASESKSTATGRAPKTAAEEKLERLLAEEDEERNLGKIDDIQNLRFERRKAALQHEIKVLKGEVVEKKEGAEASGSPTATPQTALAPIPNIINAEVVKAVTSLPEGKQAKAWESLMEYQMRALNPNMSTVKYIVDALRDKPESEVKQSSPSELLREILVTMKMLREEATAITTQQHPALLPPPPPKGFLDELIDDETKKMVKAKIVKTIFGEETPGQPQMQLQPGQKTGMRWDPQHAAFIPNEMTYEQYLEWDDRLYKRSKEEKTEAEKAKRDNVLVEQLQGIVQYAKKQAPQLISNYLNKRGATQQPPVQTQASNQPQATPLPVTTPYPKGAARKSKEEIQNPNEPEIEVEDDIVVRTRKHPNANTMVPSEVKKVAATQLDDGSLTFPCAQCSLQIMVEPQDIGKKIKCPQCGYIHNPKENIDDLR